MHQDHQAEFRIAISEARAQARVNHERVCKVYEVGEVEGKVFIAMQYVNGRSLSGEATDKGPSLAVAENKLWIAFKGKDSDKIFYKSFDGQTWSARQDIPGVTTSHSPQLVLVQNMLFAVYHKEDASKIAYNYLTEAGWSPQVKLQGLGISKFPGVAAGPSSPLYLAFRGEETPRIWYATVYL